MQAFEELVRQIMETPEILEGSRGKSNKGSVNLGSSNLANSASACGC